MAGASGGCTERVTVRLSEELLSEIESLVDDGDYGSVSAVLRDGAATIVSEESTSDDANR